MTIVYQIQLGPGCFIDHTGRISRFAQSGIPVYNYSRKQPVALDQTMEQLTIIQNKMPELTNESMRTDLMDFTLSDDTLKFLAFQGWVNSLNAPVMLAETAYSLAEGITGILKHSSKALEIKMDAVKNELKAFILVDSAIDFLNKNNPDSDRWKPLVSS